MVFVGVGRQRCEDCRIDRRHLRREQRLVAEVHQRFVGVVAQESADVVEPATLAVQLPAVGQFVVVKIHQQIEGEIFQFFALAGADDLQSFLVLVADVIAMHRFIANDQADQIRSVGQLSPAGEVHRQPEAGVEEKGFEEHAGDFFLQRLVGLIVTQHQLRLALQGITAFAPGEGGIHFLAVAQRGKYGAVRAGMNRLHKADVRQHRLLMRG